jgi:hypothetical protein
MNVNFEFDPEKLQRGMNELHKNQIPFASSLAINRLLFLTQQNLKRGVDRWVDGGAVSFTKSGVQYRQSSKKNLAGFIYTADNRPYMKTMIYGGVRKPLKNYTALIVPGYSKKRSFVGPSKQGLKLNKRGNIPRNTVKRLMSKSTKQFVGPRKRQPKTDHFIGRPKGQEHRPQGLYRIEKGVGPRLLIAMQDKQKTYKSIWPANKIALKYADKNFNFIFGRTLSQAIATSIPRVVDSTGY